MKTNVNDIEKQKNKTFILKIVLTTEEINREYTSSLKSVQSGFETKGFRKGKAPLDLVEQQISKPKILEEVASHLISQAYDQKIKENNLKPIIQPQIKITNPPITLEKDWEIEIIGCELPEIEIDPKYQPQVIKINSAPEKKEPKAENDHDHKHDKLDEILNTLIKHCRVDLPPILINSDIENRMSQLVDQTSQAGITVTQYLKTRNQTLEQYRAVLTQQIVNEWTVNLAIDKISKDQKMEVTKEETEALLKQNPKMANNPNLVYYLITQQKVFDYLQHLR
ncbi:MAG: trigger factor [Candidatus Shapirobacteria bacterium]|jgi:FKBP-type peptidyl-prolyl cis-trans isomerase (trigger factor)